MVRDPIVMAKKNSEEELDGMDQEQKLCLEATQKEENHDYWQACSEV